MGPIFEGAHKDPRFWGFLGGVVAFLALGGGLTVGAIKWEDVVAYGSIPAILLGIYGIKKALD